MNFCIHIGEQRPVNNVPTNAPTVNVPTVSDSKRAFYAAHTHPINSIYRRVVEELLVEMHLLSVNSVFAYDPIFALGVINSYDRFMESYRPEADRVSILNAVCSALKQDVTTYRRDAEAMLAAVEGVSEDDLIAWLSGTREGAPEVMQRAISALAGRGDDFKYSRLFGIGLFTVLEKAGAKLLKQKSDEPSEQLQAIANHLHLPTDKLKKDLETYASNLEKMAQAKVVMEEAIQAERKKRAQREDERKAKAEAKAKAEDEKDSETNASES